MVEKFGFEHSDDKVETDKLQEEIDKRDKNWAEEENSRLKRTVEKISDGPEKIKVVPMYTWGSKETIGDSFETEAYVIRQKVNGKDTVYVGHNQKNAKKREKECYDVKGQNQDLGVNDRYKIESDGSIVLYATNPENWNPPATWKAKDKILKADDKLVSLKNKIMGTDTDSRLKKDLQKHSTGHAEVGEMESER